MQELPIIGNNIIKLDEIDSTNSYSAALLKNQKVTEGLIIMAIHQTNGRGQMGTNWHSPPGESLTFSVILSPSFLLAIQQFYLNMAISIGVYEYLSQKKLHNVSIKWPNDILVNHKKIAGILIENSLKALNINHSIIGIGLNVNTNSIKNIPHSTSLFLETGNRYIIEDELTKLSYFLNKYYMLLRLNKWENLKKEYLQHLFGYKKQVRIIKDNKQFLVQVIDIEESGKIILQKENGQFFSAAFKEFEWIL